MKLAIETWLENNKLPDEATHLINNSIICYKAGAFTASLLMTYLGFLVVIKNRVMTANKPALLPLHKWTSLLRELQDEDKWEAAAFDALQKRETLGAAPARVRTEDPIFVVNDNIRIQVRYWKDRRNDCAHNKDNAIIGAHVEAFWSFLSSNLTKITVEGGMASLINKLVIFYDRNQTPAHQPLLPIVQEISSSVEKADLPLFWRDAFQAIDDTGDWFYNRSNTFIQHVLSLSDTLVTSSMIDYLKSEEQRLLPYIDEHPEIIQLLGYTEPEIRHFWRTKVINRPAFLKIYASMLRNSLIPSGEIAEANQFFAIKKEYTNDPMDQAVLVTNGFGPALYYKLFVEPDTTYYLFWKTLQNDYIVYRQYLEFFSLTPDIVRFTSEQFSKSWHSYFLKEQLEDLFTHNKIKRDEFNAIANTQSIPLPSLLPSLTI